MSMSYEAELDREYQELTEKHTAIRRELEAALCVYLQQRKGKPVTIQGPYGSGKTQLLYHLFKFVWAKGGIGIYTHLEKILPEREMASADYTSYLKEVLDSEVELLRNGESRLMSGGMGKVKDYAVRYMKEVKAEDPPIFLFVDEVEQQYKVLDMKVKTDDHSPMKEALRAVERGDSGFYLVLAFAPVSFYEFSRGEAQTRSFLPMMLPVLTAKNLREAHGPLGNLIWWMGRGRYGWALKVLDTFNANMRNTDACSKKELLDLGRNLGSIGGVPCIVSEVVETIDDFGSFRDFLIHLEPRQAGGELISGDMKVVKRCRYFSPQHNVNALIEKGLRSSKISSVTDIGYYLSNLLDAVTASDGKAPFFTDLEDWRELFSMVGDIILEFEGDQRLPSADLARMQSDADFISEFAFSVRHAAEDAATLQEAYCMAPAVVRSLFPFPISSPNLTSEKIAKQRETLAGQSYLGREDRDDVSIFLFLNDDKIKQFLSLHASDFLAENRVLMAVNLGENQEFELPKIGQWLQKEGRLRINTPRGILSDFLVSFFYWISNERGSALPITGLLHSLEESQATADREKARKIGYYTSRVREYFERESPGMPALKYVLKDKTGFDSKIGFAPQVMGFAFVDSKTDLEAMYKFRQEFEKTQFVQAESKRKQTGVPTALESVVVETRGTISSGAVLRRIRDSFGSHVPDLQDVVKELDKGSFTDIAVDEPSPLIFEGIYLYLKEWSDTSAGSEKFQRARASWDALTNRLNKLSEKMREFEIMLDNNIELTHALENDNVRIANIGSVLAEYGTKISPYTKFLLSTLVDTTVEIVEKELNEIEKGFKELRDSVNAELGRYKSGMEAIEGIGDNTFEWIGEDKGKVRQQFQAELKEVCQELTQGSKLDLDDTPDVTILTQGLEKTADELQTLQELDENLKECITKAVDLNTKLKQWEAK